MPVAAAVFTLYVSWSPWHYSGQNFGVAAMFLRRRGIALEGAGRRWLHASFVLSYALTLLALRRLGGDLAHGRILAIDASAAEAMEGVEAVFTGAQLAEGLPPQPVMTPFPAPPHYAVTPDVVRFVGEPVAVVVASDRYIARDAADAIIVEYEPLPAVVDPETASAPGAGRSAGGHPHARPEALLAAR